MPLPSFTPVVDNVDIIEATNINPVYTEVEQIAAATLHTDYSNNQTLSGNLTLVDSDLPIQYIDPGGSDRNVELPAESSANHVFVIANIADAAETLTVLDDAAATIDTVAQGEVKQFVSDGTSWLALSGGGAADLSFIWAMNG